jgi:hypothetical protein
MEVVRTLYWLKLSDDKEFTHKHLFILAATDSTMYTDSIVRDFRL